MQSKLIGIKGIGVVSPLQVGRDAFTAALIDGETAPFSSAPDGMITSRLRSDPAEMLETAKTYLDRGSALALAAASLARKDAGWDSGAFSSEGSGISLGTAYGCPETMLRFWQSVVQKGPRLANSLFFSHSYPNIPASMEAIEHSLAGTHLTFCQGLASGGLAVEAAMDALTLGSADRMFAGGFDTLPPAGALPRPGPAQGDEPPSGPSLFFENSRPISSEGAVVLALESCTEENGDAYFCKLAGVGSASFLPIPTEEGANAPGWSLPEESSISKAVAASMERALRRAGRKAEEVDLVVMSACGVPALDLAEAAGLKMLFGARINSVAVTTLTGRTGCTPGASALYGLIGAGVALREEWVIEVGCPIGPEVPSWLQLAVEPREQPVTLALVNSIDPQGACVSFVVVR